MKEYAPDAIRNVVFASHSGSGKTALQEACLHLAGATDRLGKVEEGNTASDYMPDEIKRKSSIYAALLAFEWDNTKFNFLDTPGYADFFGEVCSVMSAAENVVLVANATAGVEVSLESAARRAGEHDLACFVFINHLDRERAAFDPTFDALRSRLHLPLVALTYPLGLESAHRGFIDVMAQKGYEDNAGKLNEVPIPAESTERVAALRQQLVEAVVECDDDLMTKYLDGEELALEEIQSLLKKCVASRKVVPVLCGSATKLSGVKKLLETLKEFGVSPVEAPARVALDGAGSEAAMTADPNAPFSGFVFKTFSDPHTGRLTFIKIVSGKLSRDADVINVERGHHERLAHLYSPLGKKQSEVPALQAGDIVLVTKLKGTTTGDTLASTASAPRFPPATYPESLYSLAIEPVTHGDDDKMSDALAKLREEDKTCKVTRNAETSQTVISGLGDIHLTTVVARLKSNFGVDVKTEEPRVAYRETIRQKINHEGKLKKQSGGHGQFADVLVELEPGEPGSGFQFAERVVGGSVPRNFIPAVEEGAREAAKEGPLAGYPLVDVKLTLYDGKYHDVDSSFQTFKIAGSLALRGGAKEASPVLLEPVMETTIEAPEDAAGEIMGDLNGRRGQILSIEPTGNGTTRVKAYIPDAELVRYPLVLRALTHGRGSFTKQFDHYNPVPENVARPIM
ncbi:MAG TPA: elongation factor G, partial [Abditibacteriaceae bacterium]|nr:elongation factor G [Abditibacteriaceae bacterium]